MQIYRNRDFYLSSFLFASACNLIGTPVSGGITTFIFEEDKNLQFLVNEFYALKASVKPTKYANAINTLKSISHASKSNANSKDNSYVSQYRSNKK